MKVIDLVDLIKDFKSEMNSLRIEELNFNFQVLTWVIEDFLSPKKLSLKIYSIFLNKVF